MIVSNPAVVKEESSNVLMSSADTASGLCLQAVMDAGNTVVTVVELEPTESDERSGKQARPRNNSRLTFASSERQRRCVHCNKPFEIKRPTNYNPRRFCSNVCKRANYYAKTGK